MSPLSRAPYPHKYRGFFGLSRCLDRFVPPSQLSKTKLGFKTKNKQTCTKDVSWDI